jgi:3-oxoacyl-[acyl-carrier-protein] synthase II
MRRRVLITGIGLVSALGNDLEQFERRLMAGESGIRKVTRHAGNREIEVCAAAAEFDAGATFSKMELLSLDRVSQMAAIAARQALAGWPGLGSEPIQGSQGSKGLDGRAATGVYVGCGMGGSGQIETTYQDLFISHAERVRPVTVVNVMANAPAAHIALRHGLHGANLTYSTACSSSAIAIGEASRAIRHGYLDSALAGGTEALLVFGSLHGWQALGAMAKPGLDPGAACRPFSADRTGLVLGEGAAMLLLEAEEHALARGAVIFGELLGYGSNCDASHLTRPDAGSQADAMRAALLDAGVTPAEIGYVNAHGTATTAGDLSETAALKQTFGNSVPPVSATKASHGHTLGAAGALELIVSLCALRTQRLPPTLNLQRPDPACDLDYVPNHARPASFEIALSNSFAFGGSNASLVVGNYKP